MILDIPETQITAEPQSIKIHGIDGQYHCGYFFYVNNDVVQYWKVDEYFNPEHY